MTPPEHVLITGASGRVGSSLMWHLRSRYRLRLVDLAGPADNEIPSLDADICDTPAMTTVLTGMDALVHLAAEPATRATWEDLRKPNIDGLYSVFEAARRAKVPRIVFASTNHVTGMYDRDGISPVLPDMPVRPDCLYGVTKAFGEALGRFYSDEYGISVLCLRIGWVLEKPHDDQARVMWISPRDLAHLIDRCLQSQVRFGVYYGVSDNGRRKWSIDNARAELGFEPLDDAERFFTD